MIHVVLFQPEIPPNTGNIGRLCAITGCRLHLVHPLGFEITDRHLKRSGMDYWRQLDVQHHADWRAFRESALAPKRLWLLSTRGAGTIWDVAFEPEDGLVFGNESSGAPDWLHEEIGASRRVRIPHFRDGFRSLNLSTSAGVAVFEALRQLSIRGLLPDAVTPADPASASSKPAR